VLVLDEPTNDLDVETLELLEELLFAYKGTLLLVSHDRAFLNNVVTSTLVFEGDGRVQEYAGGYDDWLSQRPEAPAPQQPARQEKAGAAGEKAVREKPLKLSYRQERELESLPERIEAMEAEQAELCRRLADPALYRQDPGGIGRAREDLARLEKELAEAYARWEALESFRG
jgi:ATP-binding cassette subfamily F protein uup